MLERQFANFLHTIVYTPFCGFSSENQEQLVVFWCVLLLDTLHGAFACAQAKRRRSSVGCSGSDTFGSLEL